MLMDLRVTSLKNVRPGEVVFVLSVSDSRHYQKGVDGETVVDELELMNVVPVIERFAEVRVKAFRGTENGKPEYLGTLFVDKGEINIVLEQVCDELFQIYVTFCRLAKYNELGMPDITRDYWDKVFEIYYDTRCTVEAYDSEGNDIDYYELKNPVITESTFSDISSNDRFEVRYTSDDMLFYGIYEDRAKETDELSHSDIAVISKNCYENGTTYFYAGGYADSNIDNLYLIFKNLFKQTV